MVLKGLKSAPFLTQHLQHVSLLMGRCLCDDDPKGLKSWNYEKGLMWLIDHVPNLKTLEVVFTEAHYRDMRALTKDASSMPAIPEEWQQSFDYYLYQWHSDVMETWFCPSCWESVMGLPCTLQKVTFKVWSSAAIGDSEDPAAAAAGSAAVRETWDATEWWHKMKFYDDLCYNPEEEYVAQKRVSSLSCLMPL